MHCSHRRADSCVRFGSTLRREPLSRPGRLTLDDYHQLAAFRLALRRFLSLTDANARKAGLTPQQHQALLSIKGAHPARQEISIGELADHLLLKNHSAVELVDRLSKAGLVSRAPSPEDRRRVLLRVTPQGEALLEAVSSASLVELRASTGLRRAFLDIAEAETARDSGEAKRSRP
ncbi:MAG: MarR family transcriptional regulator [Proteobacteria bacterium]|nr:MarR family transcriptional regulator [Pseudomonadota bacterium]